jgi:DNA-binding NtrC family response regulator
MQEALKLTEDNREEAAKILGIGERTLYRMIQDWKLEDKINETLREVGGDVDEAASKLQMDVGEIRRKLKKWGKEE